MRISDWSSDVCSSDLSAAQSRGHGLSGFAGEGAKLAASAAPMRPDSAGGAFARLVHMRAEGGDDGAQSRLDGGVADQSFAIEQLDGARDHQAAFEPSRGAQLAQHRQPAILDELGAEA